MLKAGVGKSQEHDPYAAGVNACQEALTELGQGADFILLFSSVAFDQEKVLAGARSLSKNALLAGCSTSGEITTQGPAEGHNVTAMAIKSDRIKFYGGVGENIKADNRKAGQEMTKAVVKQAGGKDKLRSLMMFPDVLAGNGAEIVRGVLDVLGKNFPAVGGAPGDDFKFEKTYQYLNDKIYSGAVVGVGLSGEFKWGVGVKHGWLPLGMPMRVTKSEGSVLHELDGKPAIKIYEDYFGPERAADLRKETLARLAITYPLGMQVEGSDELLIRDPITVDEKGSITCAAEIPQGAEIRLMIGSREDAIKVARLAAANALEQLDGAEPKAVIIFNCIARNKLFGEHSKEEIDAIQEVIGKNVPLIGFYTYGEQAPLDGQVRDIKQCKTTFHNETVVIFALAE